MTATPGSSAADRAEVTAIVARSGSSFYWAMRTLAPERRLAMYAVYAFCRLVDDVADEPADTSDKRRRLDAWRDEVARSAAGAPETAVGRVLAPAIARFALDPADLVAVIDGVTMDLDGVMVAPAEADFRLYCARVAGAVGRLSVRVFGLPEPEAHALATALGEAVQITNVLRDVAEDAADGRLYLPRELLAAHGLPPGPPGQVVDDPRVAAVCAALAMRAEARFVEARRLLDAMPGRAARPVRMMLEVYRRLLVRLQRRGFAELGRTVRLGRAAKLWLALRYGLI